MYKPPQFLDKIWPKRYFWSKIGKLNMTIEFFIFKLFLEPNFSLNWQFLFFGPNLPEEGYSWLKIEKVNITINILFIQISLVTKFQLKLTISMFLSKFTQKGLFLVENRKSEHHHWIWLFELISRVAKF